MVLDGGAQALTAALAEAGRFSAEGKLEAAGAVYQNVIAQYPDCGAAWFGLGGLGMQIGDNETAVTFFEQARAVGLADPACLINLGEAYRRLGQLTVAADKLAQACREAPSSRDAHFNLGVVLAAGRQYGPALEHIECALAIDPGFVEAWRTKAEIYRNTSQLDDAEMAFARVLELAPAHEEALLGLAESRRLKKDFVGAMEGFEALLAKNERHLYALTGLGAIALEQRNYASAEAMYRNALAQEPGFREAAFGLGVTLLKAERFESAEVQLRLAVDLDADNIDSRIQLGEALFAQNRYAESLQCYEEVLGRDPQSISALVGIGNIYLHTERVPEAVAQYYKASVMAPGNFQIYANLALASFDLGKFAEAETYGLKAVELAGDVDDRDLAVQNLAQIQLRRGRLADGWNNYERRISRRRGDNLPFPAWHGEALANKRILLWQDQGIGDVIFFASLFDEIIDEAGEVVLECDKKLLPLVRRSFPQAIVVPRNFKTSHPLMQENFDYHCAQGSLPLLRRSSFACFPRPPNSILAVDPARRKYWRERVGALGIGIKVGICWRSMLSRGRRDLSYSELREWQSIFALPGINLVNLQYDRCEEELAEAQSHFGKEIVNFREVDMFDDLDEVAALMSELDLVISAPTSVSMLAAAVGTPTYLATTFFDWSCLGRRKDLWFKQLLRYPRKWNQSWDEIFSAMAIDIRRRFKLGG